MNSENVKLSARNEVASKAALDNINRALTGTAPAPQSTRRQRVVRDSVSNTRSGTSTDSSQQPRGLPDPSHDTASSLTEKGSTYATPGVRSPVVEPSPEILNYITSTVTSQGSLEAKSVDARSYAASSVKSSHVTTAKTPFSSTDANINPPHFERPSSAVPSQNLSESITFNPNTTAKSSQPERLPSVAPTQKLSKWDLFTQINDFPSGPQTHSVTSYVSSTRPTYQELVAAQNKSPILESIRDHETKIAATSNEPMSSGVAAKSAKADAPFPCSYDDCSMGFNDITALKNHKYLDHEGWCKLCDVDTDDYKALLEHKKDSLRHVVCQWCGKDFRSGSGRDLHERQVSISHSPFRNPGSFVTHRNILRRLVLHVPAATIFTTALILLLIIWYTICARNLVDFGARELSARIELSLLSSMMNTSILRIRILSQLMSLMLNLTPENLRLLTEYLFMVHF